MKVKGIAAGIIIVLHVVIVSPVASGDMPGPDPTALWNYITKVSPYTTWAFWPDHKGMQAGRAPHGPFHKVYVNDHCLNSSAPPVQYGSICVKENFNENRELQIITVMYKIKGFNTKDGDWFWVRYSLDGKARPFGKPIGCIGCHGVRDKNDFIVVHEFE